MIKKSNDELLSILDEIYGLVEDQNEIRNKVSPLLLRARVILDRKQESGGE